MGSVGETGFQFLGIPPKGEQDNTKVGSVGETGFQFLGIPPKGELVTGQVGPGQTKLTWEFPISRDPPEGGTRTLNGPGMTLNVSNF